jgi:ABC-type multidrug transport system fused ATPase/permease subunit
MAKSAKKWSAEVTAHDHPFDLDPGLFANGTAQQIAAALKKSAQDAARHSDDPYRTAMSMLDFYVNRAGDKLSIEQRAKLDQAKAALRQSFGR